MIVKNDELKSEIKIEENKDGSKVAVKEVSFTNKQLDKVIIHVLNLK